MRPYGACLPACLPAMRPTCHVVVCVPSGICYCADMTTYYPRYGALEYDYCQISVCESCLLCRESDCESTYYADSPDCDHWQAIDIGADERLMMGCRECDPCELCESGRPACQCCDPGHGFMSTRCDACGTHLSGDRHPYIIGMIAPHEYVHLFVSGYLAAMLWANVYDETRHDWQSADIEPDSLDAIERDARAFMASNYYDISTAVERFDGYGFDSAGHDYALTRNGHGAGYLDRGLGDIGKRLDSAASARGESHLLPDDSGEMLILE